MLGSRQHAARSSPKTGPIFTWLRAHDLLDARGYAMAPLRQRVLGRMRAVGCASVSDYLDKLASDPVEPTALVAELLGSRSVFGVGAETWRAVAGHLAGSRACRAALRRRFSAWSVGCGTGEEAFTLAMMFAEAFGLEALARRVEIVATDIDATALAMATAARYGAASLGALPAPILAAYFDGREGERVVREELRRAVRFERRDLLRDAPLRGQHLVVCRNLASSFAAPGRRRAARALVSALATGGLLVFGRGEWPELGAQLETIDAARGIYRKVDEGGRA